MPRKSNFFYALSRLHKYFENAYGPYTKSDIDTIFEENRSRWNLPYSMNINKFIDELVKANILIEQPFFFQEKTVTLYYYARTEVTPYMLGAKLYKKGFFSYYSALYLHGLTEQVPKKIFITSEVERHTEKRPRSIIPQENIDKAFRKEPRQTNNTAIVNNFEYTRIYGQFTEKLGIVGHKSLHTKDKRVSVTNIERTLIDAVKSPYYCGGIDEVIKAFSCAREQKVSINKLIVYLKVLDYSYPYHQALGFIMEYVGKYPQDRIDKLLKFGLPYKFYLTHVNNDTPLKYSEKWQLYYPAYLD